MSTPKYIFYLIYFIFHVLLIGGSIYMMNRIDASDFNFINGFVGGDNIIFTKGNVIFFSILGIILFLINIVMVNMQITGAKKRQVKMESEINSLKAKIYDLNEAQIPTGLRKADPKKNPSASSSESDEQNPGRQL
jgi:hypothetical protein